jgi:hypothetical protein
MRTRRDASDDLPHRVYLRRGQNSLTWFYKDPKNKTHVLAKAPHGDERAIAAAIERAKQFGVALKHGGAVGDYNPMGRASLRRLTRVMERRDANVPQWAWRVYRQAKLNSVGRKIAWTLTAAEFATIVAACGGRCSVSGIPFDTPTRKARGPFGASIDRIDCAGGYSFGNVRLVCVIVNIAMNTWGESALIKLGLAIAEYRDTGAVLQSLEHGETQR